MSYIDIAELVLIVIVFVVGVGGFIKAVNNDD